MPTRWFLRAAALTLVAAGLVVPAARAGDAPQTPSAGLRWDREGYAALLGAAVDARAAGKRLLLGLSGSPT